MVFAVGTLIERLRREAEEERRRLATRDQAALFRRWMRLGDAPSQAFLNPQGFAYERARMEDENLRPGRFAARQAEAPPAPSPLGLQPPTIAGLQSRPSVPLDQQMLAGALPSPEVGIAPMERLAAGLPEMGITPGQFAEMPTAEQYELFPPMAQPPDPAQALRDIAQTQANIEAGRAGGPSLREQLGQIGAGIAGVPSVALEALERVREIEAPLAETLAGGVRLGVEQTGLPVIGAGPVAGPRPGRATELVEEEGLLPGLRQAGEEAPIVTEFTRPTNLVPIPFVDPAVARLLGVAGKVGARVAPKALRSLIQRASRLIFTEATEPAVREAAQEFVQAGERTLAESVPAEPLAAVPEAPPVPAAPARAVPEAPRARAEPELQRVKEVAEAPELPEIAPKTLRERLDAGEIPPISRGNPAERLIELISSAKRLKPAERALRSQELARRAARAGATMEQAAGRERLQAGLGQLKGRLPSPEFTPPEGELLPAEIDDLFNQVHAFYAGKERAVFTDIDTMQALEKVLAGNLPQSKELDLLERVFGPELAEAILQKRPLSAKAWEELMGVINAPRTLMTVLDFSAIFRQAAPTVGERRFWGNIPAYFRMFASQRANDALEAAVRAHPLYDQAIDDGISLTFAGSVSKLAGREEAFILPGERSFIGRLLRKMPGVRQSERGHTGFLSKLRFDLYTDYAPLATGEGERKALARMINDFTGRGDLGPLNEYSPLLGGLFFSARLNMARIRTPLALFSRSPLVRKMAARNLIAFVGSGIALLSAVKASGLADVELDPRSTDWGKIRVGPTRIDLWAGFQPMARLVARAATGQTKTAMGDIQDINVFDAVVDFIRTKTSPPASLATDVVAGESIIGEKFEPSVATLKREAFSNLVSMFVQDVVDAVRDGGWAHGLLALPASLGVGVQTYVVPSRRTANLIAEALQAGDISDEYDRLPLRLSELNPDDRERFEQLHPEIFEELEERTAETVGGLGRGEEAAVFGALTGGAREAVHEGLDRLSTDVQGGRFGDVAEYESRQNIWDEASRLFDERRGAIANAERVFAEQVARREEREPVSPDQRVLQRFFAFSDRYQDLATEEEWTARDAAYDREFSEAEQRVIEQQLGVNDHRIERERQRLSAMLEGYYELPETPGQRREAWRRRNPQADAALWVLGRVAGVLTPAAQAAAIPFWRGMFEMSLTSADVPRRVPTGGGASVRPGRPTAPTIRP